MRAGTDAIKPDVRVRQALQTTLARVLDITRLILDQLLWGTGNAPTSEPADTSASPTNAGTHRATGDLTGPSCRSKATWWISVRLVRWILMGRCKT